MDTGLYLNDIIGLLFEGFPGNKKNRVKLTSLNSGSSSSLGDIVVDAHPGCECAVPPHPSGALWD